MYLDSLNFTFCTFSKSKSRFTCRTLPVGRDGDEASSHRGCLPPEGHAGRRRGNRAASRQQTPNVGRARTHRDETGDGSHPRRKQERVQPEHANGAEAKHGKESGLYIRFV